MTLTIDESVPINMKASRLIVPVFDADEAILDEGDAAFKHLVQTRRQRSGKASHMFKEGLPSSQVHIYQLHWLSWRNNRRVFIQNPLWDHRLKDVGLQLRSTVDKLKSIINRMESILQGNGAQYDYRKSEKTLFVEWLRQWFNNSPIRVSPEQLDAFVHAIEAIGGTNFLTEVEIEIDELEHYLVRLPLLEPWTEELIVPNDKTPLENMSQKNLCD